MLALAACVKTDLFEKSMVIPGNAWKNEFRPAIRFNINDTASLYNVYVILRHTDAYLYNNLWINLYIQSPGDSLKKFQLDLQLADKEKGWLGNGMDDIFEHRIRISQEPISFSHSGTYTFTLEQIMRESPLNHVMNAGVRVERVR